MVNLLLSLVAGVILIIAANGLLLRFSSLDAKQAAIAVALASVGIYVPLAIIYWPGGDIFAIQLAIYLLSSYVFGLIVDSRSQVTAEGGMDDRRFHWGPAAIIGFFALLLIVDSIFVILAEHGLSSRLADRLLPGAQGKGDISSAFPGMISHDFQKKESLYNEYLVQVERQQQRGWQVRKGWLQQPVVNEPAVFQVMALTRDGDPLPGAEISGQFLRPADSRLDRTFTMQEVTSGVYQATLNLPAAGRWDLILQVRKTDALHEVRASTSVSAP